MTKDALANAMSNPDYFLERINAIKKTPVQEPVLNIILKKHFK